MSRARVIIHAEPGDFILASRAAAFCLRDDYQWPKDGWGLVQYGDDLKNVFNVRRNKVGVTVYGPIRAHATPPGEGA
ncbi:hypothetical protein [Sphingomonas sp.]|uniref:hypothetical protein n=1 Tax=Sphingomonas sp. TaxID=28214 RepID=UPI0031E061B0